MAALGLPAWLWKNTRHHPATSFPAGTIHGDRILRTDQDTTKGGRWYTYVIISGIGYWVPDVLSGTATVTLSSQSSGSATVNFGITLPSIPKIVTSISLSATTVPAATSRPQGASTTGFSAQVSTTNGTLVSQVFTIDWIATP